MTKREQYAYQGNFRLGYPELYHKEAATVEELERNNMEMRKAVRKDFPFYKLYELQDEDVWRYVSCWVILTEAQIREFKDFLDWKLIKEYQQHISTDFKREFGI